jgi:hypothetical protein
MRFHQYQYTSDSCRTLSKKIGSHFFIIFTYQHLSLPIKCFSVLLNYRYQYMAEVHNGRSFGGKCPGIWLVERASSARYCRKFLQAFYIDFHDREKNTKYVRTPAPICKDRPVLIKFSFLLECKPITLKPLSKSPLRSSRKPTWRRNQHREAISGRKNLYQGFSSFQVNSMFPGPRLTCRHRHFVCKTMD